MFIEETGLPVRERDKEKGQEERKVRDLIETLPVVALRGMTILPGMVIHFDVSRERSVKAIEQAMLR